jgi:hypothetical protein
MILKIKRCFKNYLLGVMSLGMYEAVHAHGHIQVIETPPKESFKTNNHGQRVGDTSKDIHLRADQFIRFMNLTKEILFLLRAQLSTDNTDSSFVNVLLYKDGERDLRLELTESSSMLRPSFSMFKDSRHFLYQLHQKLHHLIYIDFIRFEYQKYLTLKYWELYSLLMRIESPPPGKEKSSQADLKLHEIFMLFYDLSARLQNPEKPLTYREVISQFIEKEQHLIESFNQEFFLNLFK